MNNEKNLSCFLLRLPAELAGWGVFFEEVKAYVFATLGISVRTGEP